MIRRPPISTLFPYTTLIQSVEIRGPHEIAQLLEIGFGLAREAHDERCAQRNSGNCRSNALQQFQERFAVRTDRKSTRLNSSHGYISYAVFCLKKKQEERMDS